MFNIYGLFAQNLDAYFSTIINGIDLSVQIGQFVCVDQCQHSYIYMGITWDIRAY